MTASARPARLLPLRQLALLSVYWFGINAVWGGYEWFGQTQVELIVGQESRGLAIGLLEALGALVPILVVPTVGSLRDYTSSRFGKRKGYIISCAIFDLLFLSGLAVLARAEPAAWDGSALGSPALMALYTLLFLGLQFSSNVAQGPYQGFVPDLVAEPQVGLASGAVGIMRMGGNIGGAAIMMVGAAFDAWGLALFLIAVIEFGLAALTFAFVENGPPAKPRKGRSWAAIAREAWGLDVLHEPSFLRMTLVRFLFLMGTSIFVNISAWYLRDSLGQ
ncbi:MAG: MFS transporter, partial [Candidatus Limnocylindrales bacterium]